MAEAHSHGGDVGSGNIGRVRVVFWLTASYAVVQAVGGWFSGIKESSLGITPILKKGPVFT